MTVRTRFAPSPTGFLHIGGLRTALFCWLYARRHAGQFALRIEDTDLERSTPTAIAQILDGMDWANLNYDVGPVYQTQRFARYKEVIEDLLAAGKAYHCYCSKEELELMRAQQIGRGEKPRYDGRWRDRSDSLAGVAPVVRFKNPMNGAVVVDDIVHGRVIFQNAELDDLIIARSDGTPTYNFCVIVDDMDMEITHVIRGDDHLNNTPRQINMLAALDRVPPVYAHLPMILGADGTKLSKRHGAVSVLQYKEEGFLPEAVLNYLVRLGWSHGDQEIFSVDEMIRLFDIADVNKSASAFDVEKLIWLNQQHIIHAPATRIVPVLRWHLERQGVDTEDTIQLERIVMSQRARSKTILEMALNSLFFFRAPGAYDDAGVRKHVTPQIGKLLTQFCDALEKMPSWSAAAIHEQLTGFVAANGLTLGKFAQPIRLAVSGGTVSPPIDATLEILGKAESIARLRVAASVWCV